MSTPAARSSVAVVCLVSCRRKLRGSALAQRSIPQLGQRRRSQSGCFSLEIAEMMPWRFVLREDYPAAPARLAEPLGVESIVCEMVSVLFDVESSSTKVEDDFSAERTINEPGERFRRLHSSRTGSRPRFVRGRG